MFSILITNVSIQGTQQWAELSYCPLTPTGAYLTRFPGSFTGAFLFLVGILVPLMALETRSDGQEEGLGGLWETYYQPLLREGFGYLPH